MKTKRALSYAARIKTLFKDGSNYVRIRKYCKSFEKYSFEDCSCRYKEQFEASIIRLYHTIEKGLSYEEYRPGFGEDNVERLIISLEQYASKGFDVTEFFYETALSCLDEYVKKNKEFGYENQQIEKRINQLQGNANHCGGTIVVPVIDDQNQMNYEQLIMSRHSVRHFSSKPIDMQVLKEAIQLAQHTPSACNRQGWKTRIIADKKKKEIILANQNGNRGFGQEFDKILVVTADLRAQQKNRELFQGYIDGGMYAQNVLNALYFKGIASVPLSASLTERQNNKIREIMNISNAEIFILFIGIGNYPIERFRTTRSERKTVDIEVL